MKFVAYWNGNIPAVTDLFFASFLATQDSILEVYLENCEDLGPLAKYQDSPRIKIYHFNLAERCEGTVFECFFRQEQDHALNRLLTRAYKKYYRHQAERYSNPQKIVTLPDAYIHPVMGLTPRYTRRMAAKWEHNKAFIADVFRCWMAATETTDFIYADLDICFLRNFAPLTQQGDFVYEWEYQKFANSAVLFSSNQGAFRQGMNALIRQTLTAIPWIVFSYDSPILEQARVLPCEQFDPLWKQKVFTPSGEKVKLGDFFVCNEKTETLLQYLTQTDTCYAHHWHNRWSILPEPGSPYQVLFEQFTHKLKDLSYL